MNNLKKSRAAKIIIVLKRLFPRAKIALNYSNNWELLVAVILSAQCTDKKVNEVTAKLFSAKGGSPPDARLPDGQGRAGATGGKKYRTLNDYVKASASRRTVKEFEQNIRSTGFYRNKAKNILAAAKIIQKKYHGQLPKTMAEMLELPGVARKTANVVLGNAYGVVEGIAVDTHVRRLAYKLGLTKHTDPNKIEKDLMAILPKKEWFGFTYRLIAYGRKYCPARHKDHSKCPLAKFYVN